jgi:prolipoprotein diacylglyceryltransferase
LYFFWRRSQKAENIGKFQGLFTKPGSTFALMFILYGIARFLMEFLRDDNPFEVDSLTISQLIGIPLIIFGIVLMVVFAVIRTEKAPVRSRKNIPNP